MRHANYEGWDLYFGRIGVHRESAMVPLDRALVSSYRLLIVTMSAICSSLVGIYNPSIWGAVSTLFGGGGEGGNGGIR